MAVLFEDLRVLRASEEVADELWNIIVKWDDFSKGTIGKQLVRSVDSIGANIAEAYGRYHYGEKLQFLYYARGSLYETKYWLNRGYARGLFSQQKVETTAQKLSEIAHQLNAFAKSTKYQKRNRSKNNLREQDLIYTVKENLTNSTESWEMFTQEEIQTLTVIDIAQNLKK